MGRVGEMLASIALKRNSTARLRSVFTHAVVFSLRFISLMAGFTPSMILRRVLCLEIANLGIDACDPATPDSACFRHILPMEPKALGKIVLRLRNG